MWNLLLCLEEFLTVLWGPDSVAILAFLGGVLGLCTDLKGARTLFQLWLETVRISLLGTYALLGD